MAIYKITSLNYMTAGSNRAFLNMDTVLGYELYKPVVLLRNEQPYVSSSAVSAYGQLSAVEAGWNGISGFLSSVGDLDYIKTNWDDVKSKISSVILDGMVNAMASSPLSVLCSDIVTEQRDGKWLKTDFLSKEFSKFRPVISSYTDNAVAASSNQPDIMLNEQQRYYSELSGGHRRYIRLYPPGTDERSIAEIDGFNMRRAHVNRTFVLDMDLANRMNADGDDGVDSGLNVLNCKARDGGSASTIYPMYDMIDVHVKAADVCGKSQLKSFDAAVTSKREDIYLPQLTSDPIGCCQVQSNAYMLTEATALEPAVLESSLYTQRLNGGAARSYTVQIKSNEVKTYLYGKDENGVIDAEGIPQSNLAGIEYNNITEFPQNSVRVGYSEGNEYGYIIRGKNAMDSKYNMSLGVNGNNVSAYGCRDYAGIGQFAGNQLYFKFYDGVQYNGISAGSDVRVARTDKSAFPVVPYQKVECAYLNRYTSANLHKTRFFSIKMLNTELNQYDGISDQTLTVEEKVRKKLYGQIMQDVSGAIREIVQNLQPSHTQLYRVMFDG